MCVLSNIEESRIKLANGVEIVSQRYDYDGEHPEIAVCLWKDGVAIQDICLIRPYEDNKEDTEVLVWSEPAYEDYTHKFIIPQYKDGEESNNV